MRQFSATIIKTLTALLAVSCPLTAQAAYIELFPGGVLTAGGSYDDPRVIWTAIIRLGLVVLAIFMVIRLMKDAWDLHTATNSDVQVQTVDALAHTGTALVLTMAAAVAAPYALNVFFDFVGGAFQGNLALI